MACQCRLSAGPVSGNWPANVTGRGPGIVGGVRRIGLLRSAGTALSRVVRLRHRRCACRCAPASAWTRGTSFTRAFGRHLGLAIGTVGGAGRRGGAAAMDPAPPMARPRHRQQHGVIGVWMNWGISVLPPPAASAGRSRSWPPGFWPAAWPAASTSVHGSARATRRPDDRVRAGDRGVRCGWCGRSSSSPCWSAGWLLGGVVGVGTVAYALGIGPLAQLFLRWFDTGDRSKPISGRALGGEPRERAAPVPRRGRRPAASRARAAISAVSGRRTRGSSTTGSMCRTG